MRAGPLPPVDAHGGWQLHAYVDHAIVELIANNATALVVYAAPSRNATKLSLFGAPAGATIEAWTLASANNDV